MQNLFINLPIYFLTLVLFLSAFISGCEVNPLSSHNHNDNADSNNSLEILAPISTETLSPEIGSEELQTFIFEQIKFLEKELTKKLENIDPANSEQIQSIIQKELISFFKEKQDIKYQFLCDENERWIYRCNRMTGEIECFSMSTNKLRLLSSTR